MLGAINNKLVLSIIWFFISIIVVGFTKDSSSVVVHNTLVLLTILSYALCLYVWIKSGNRWMSLYVFFVLYMMFSNLGQSFISLFPNVSDFLVVYYEFNISSIIATLQFQLLCVSAFCCGTAFYLRKGTRTVTVGMQLDMVKNPRGRIRRNNKFLYYLFIVSLLYNLADAISFVLMRQNMGYGDAYVLRSESGEGSMRLIMLWITVVLGYKYLFMRKHVGLILSSFISICVMYMLCGNRSLIIAFLAMLAVVSPLLYPHLFKKKYTVIWISLSVGLFAFLGFISDVRNDDFSAVAGYDASSSLLLSLAGIITEMGSAQYPLTITMEALNSGIPHHQTLLYFIITAFSSSSICDMLGLGGEYLPLGEWASNYVGITSYGVGYSCIAEWFMNYGWFGFIFAFFYGYFITYAECKAYRDIYRGKFIYAIVLLAFLTHHIFYARSNMFYSLFFVRLGFLLLIANYFYRNVLRGNCYREYSVK